MCISSQLSLNVSTSSLGSQVQISLLFISPSEHTQSYSIVQLLEQPSPDRVFPSSHYSWGITLLPSSQTTLQESAEVGDPPEHVQPLIKRLISFMM